MTYYINQPWMRSQPHLSSQWKHCRKACQKSCPTKSVMGYILQNSIIQSTQRPVLPFLLLLAERCCWIRAVEYCLKLVEQMRSGKCPLTSSMCSPCAAFIASSRISSLLILDALGQYIFMTNSDVSNVFAKSCGSTDLLDTPYTCVQRPTSPKWAWIWSLRSINTSTGVLPLRPRNEKWQRLLWLVLEKFGTTPQSSMVNCWKAKRRMRKYGRSWMKFIPYDWMMPWWSYSHT